MSRQEDGENCSESTEGRPKSLFYSELRDNDSPFHYTDHYSGMGCFKVSKPHHALILRNLECLKNCTTISHIRRGRFAPSARPHYVSMSTSKFLSLVEEGVMPKGFKVDGMTLWDRLDLDAAVENLKAQEAAPRRRNPIEEHYGVDA